MSLKDLLYKEFGVKTRPNVNPVTDLCKAESTKLLSNNPNRLAWLIVNLGGSIVYLGLDKDVSDKKGVLLSANGGSCSMVWDEDFNVTAWEVWGIAETAPDNVYVLEIVEV